jgi:hypothetical protein
MYANVVTARLPVYRSASYRRFQPGNCAGIGGGFCRVDAFMTRLWGGVALLQDCLVRSEGLEPPRFYSLPPQGSASTNSATSAWEIGAGMHRTGSTAPM